MYAADKIGIDEKIRKLDDKMVHQYRHKGERPALYIALLFIFTALIGAVLAGKTEIVLGIIAVWLTMFLAANIAIIKYRLSGLEVSKYQRPEINEIAQELRQRFSAPDFKIYIIEDPHPKASSLGYREPYVIIITSALLERLTSDQLKGVIGEELGHIMLGHTKVDILLGGETSSLPAVISWIGSIRNMFLAWFKRYEAFSADRIGLLATRDLKTFIDTLVLRKVGIDPDKVDYRDLANLIFELKKDRLTKFQVTMVELTSDPVFLIRLYQLFSWHGVSKKIKDEYRRPTSMVSKHA